MATDQPLRVGILLPGKKISEDLRDLLDNPTRDPRIIFQTVKIEAGEVIGEYDVILSKLTRDFVRSRNEDAERRLQAVKVQIFAHMQQQSLSSKDNISTNFKKTIDAFLEIMDPTNCEKNLKLDCI